jgi:hypothetical protein
MNAFASSNKASFVAANKAVADGGGWGNEKKVIVLQGENRWNYY